MLRTSVAKRETGAIRSNAEEPTEAHLDLPPVPFYTDPTNLANAFTRSGLVKYFWNLNGSGGQTSGPAPPNAETELIPSGTSEPTTASWEGKPVETVPPGGSASARPVSPILPLARARG
jgi:hypothetical protein